MSVHKYVELCCQLGSVIVNMFTLMILRVGCGDLLLQLMLPIGAFIQRGSKSKDTAFRLQTPCQKAIKTELGARPRSDKDSINAVNPLPDAWKSDGGRTSMSARQEHTLRDGGESTTPRGQPGHSSVNGRQAAPCSCNERSMVLT